MGIATDTDETVCFWRGEGAMAQNTLIDFSLSGHLCTHVTNINSSKCGQKFRRTFGCG